jgi:hypothetical protein
MEARYRYRYHLLLLYYHIPHTLTIRLLITISTIHSFNVTARAARASCSFTPPFLLRLLLLAYCPRGSSGGKRALGGGKSPRAGLEEEEEEKRDKLDMTELEEVLDGMELLHHLLKHGLILISRIILLISRILLFHSLNFQMVLLDMLLDMLRDIQHIAVKPRCRQYDSSMPHSNHTPNTHHHLIISTLPRAATRVMMVVYTRVMVVVMVVVYGSARCLVILLWSTLL